jgi:hypothetical protein
MIAPRAGGHTGGMRVWIDEWQQSCCGDALAQGDETTLHLRPADVPWFEGVFGGAFVRGLAGCDETHQMTEVERIVEGRVRSIHAASCAYEESTDGTGAVPVRGSGEFHRIPAIDGAFRPLGGKELVGYVVELAGAHDRR